jgi:hypothetical protein
MLESPAYRILSLSARRCLDRIEIEHIHHGGQENGQLPVTYDHFSEYGVHRHAIRRALRELAALGFIEITEQGVAGNAAHRAPNKFRLTYIRVGRVQPTHEWRHVKSTDDAEMIAKAARLGTNETPRKYRVQKQKPVPVSANHQCRIPSPQRTGKGSTAHKSPVLDSITTSRFSGGSPQRRRRKPNWSAPVVKEIYPSRATIVLLQELDRHQAELAGDPHDVWLPPKSPIPRPASDALGAWLRKHSPQTIEKLDQSPWPAGYDHRTQINATYCYFGTVPLFYFREIEYADPARRLAFEQAGGRAMTYEECMSDAGAAS